MEMVLLTALGVGGATVVGALLGFLFKEVSHRFSDAVLAFAAGVMLAAAVIGLILPSLEPESGGSFRVWRSENSSTVAVVRKPAAMIQRLLATISSSPSFLRAIPTIPAGIEPTTILRASGHRSRRKKVSSSRK